jgi:allophanate hydrolase subunit 2
MKPLLKVLSPGFHPTVQDLGVSVSGALDPVSLHLANTLVGNSDSAGGGLEIRLLGSTLRVKADSVRVALCGTNTTIDVQGETTCKLVPSR